MIGRKGWSGGAVYEKVGCCGAAAVVKEYCFANVGCATKCTTCVTSAGNCTACAANRTGPPTCGCVANHYSPGISGTSCEPCGYMCNTCADYASNCTGGTCSHSTRDPSTSMCACKTGFYDNNGAVACATCNFRCSFCHTTATNCETCSDVNRELAPACTCKAGYFEIVPAGTAICGTCSHKCSTCVSSAGNCLTCSDVTRENTPTCNCKPGYFEEGNAVCGICAKECATCTGSASNCLTCVATSNFLVPPSCFCQDTFY